MVKITKTINCDVCGKILEDDGIRSNCGKFQEPFILLDNDIALDYSCAGKIFYREVLRKVPKEKLKEWINSLKKAEGPNPLGLDLEEVKIDLLSGLEEDNPYGWDKNTNNTSNTNNTNNTNSLDTIDEIPATRSTSLDKATLIAPQKTVSNMKFLEDL